MANEIAGFDDLNFFSFSYLEYTNSLMHNRVWWVCENFRRPMEMGKKNFLFNGIAGFGLIFINNVEFNPNEPNVGATMNHHLNAR